MKKKYTIILLLTAIITVILLISVSALVDPLNKIRANTSSYFSSERNLKARMIEDNNNYNGLLLGSSKVAYINTKDNEKILNASFSSAFPEEILSFLEEKTPNVKWIALGVDYYMFHEKMPYKKQSLHFQKLNFVEKVSYCLSLNTFIYSVKSLVYKLFDKPIQYTHSGSRNIEYKLLDEHKKSYNYTSVLKKLKDRFKNYKISEKRLNDMSKIQAWADSRNITLIVWLNPYNYKVLELLDSYNNDEIGKLSPLLSTIFYNFVDLSKNYTGKQYYYKHDPYHFYPIVGDAIINDTIAPLLIK
jgi:hypothetical protein